MRISGSVPAEPWIVDETFGPWRVEGFLAEGGMARLWRVRNTISGELGALKVSRSRDPDLLARAAREGRIQSAIRHPNVLGAMDVVEVEGTPGIVLQLVEGGLTLEAELRRSPLAGATLERAVNGVLDGVEAAHKAGFIHRDLKPANVLLAPAVLGPAGEGEGWTPKIADFGLARPEFEPPEAKLTRAGYILGSAAYMAPEQARDAGSVDARADLWSLGCLIYEMVSGRMAFDGATVDEVLLNVTKARYAPLDAVVPGVEARWQVAVEACLHVNPEMRVPDVARLRAIIRGEQRWVSEGGGARRGSIPGVASPMRAGRSSGPRSTPSPAPASETFVGEGKPAKAPGPGGKVMVGVGCLLAVVGTLIWWLARA